METISCTRCGQTRDQMSAPPFPNEFGNRIFDSICSPCWDEWLKQQTAIINHYGLDLRDSKARQMLTQQTEAFLFGLPQSG